MNETDNKVWKRLSEVFEACDLKAMAQMAFEKYKELMLELNDPNPSAIFITKKGIVMPSPDDPKNLMRITKQRLEEARECYALCYIAQARDMDGKVVRENAVFVLSSGGGDKTFRITQPFTYKTVKRRGKKRKIVKVVEFEWEKESDEPYGPFQEWQSRAEMQTELDELTPQQQRLFEFIDVESGWEPKPDDYLKPLEFVKLSDLVRDPEDEEE